MRKTATRFIVIFTLLLTSASLVSAAPSKQFTPDEASNSVTKDIVKKLSKQHYAAIELDDELSARLLERFLKYVDPAKLYLTAEDIAAFDKYRTELDDQLKEGSVEAGYTVYNRLHQRTIERLEWITAKLPTLIENFDFTIDETIPLEYDDQPWAKTPAELDDRWRKRVKNDVLIMRLNDEEDILGALQKRYEYQLKRIKQITDEDVYTYYIDTFTKIYDPHTNYFSPQQMENFRISMSRSLEGIGAVLTQDYEYTKIVSLVTEGPADRQGGLKAADRIVGVGQGKEGDITSVIGWRLDEVVDLIRGDKNTWVRLEILPAKSSGDTKFISIKRGKVELEDMLVKHQVQEVFYDGEVHKVGVIEIPDFYVDFNAMSRGIPNYRSTTRDVAKALDDLKDEDIEGIVLDLRNNGGGSLQEANSLIGLFIEAGPTVQIRNSNNRVQGLGKFRRSGYYNGPVVVMINRLSASASEIVAGAIQDYKRGLVVGTTSFGKGTVQTLIKLKQGQLKLTESKFYRISGQSTQNRGVEADILYPVQYDPKEVGEGSLTGALPWDLIDPAGYPKYNNFDPIIEELRKRHDQRIDDDPDFVFLREEYEFVKANRQKKEITLNEEQRRAEREANKATLLAIENKRRDAKGLELLTSLDEEDEETTSATGEESESEADEPKEEVAKDDNGMADDDVFVIEAVHILLDQVHLQRNSEVAVNSPQQAASS